MNDVQMTIAGNVVDEPRMRMTKNNHAVTTFRVASTSRRFDREQECFVDQDTLFVTVTCWRALAENAHESLHKGQPIVVTGRYYSREYTVNEQPRVAYELEATAMGHNLIRGVTTFSKKTRSRSPQVEVDEGGMPAEASDEWLAKAEAEAEVEVGLDAGLEAADGLEPVAVA